MNGKNPKIAWEDRENLGQDDGTKVWKTMLHWAEEDQA